MIGLPRFQRSVNGEIYDDYVVDVELVGPGIRHQMAVHLERDGHALVRGDDGYVEPPATRKAVSCDDPPIEWEFTLKREVAKDVWCVISWVDPPGDEVWTNAYAKPLGAWVGIGI